MSTLPLALYCISLALADWFALARPRGLGFDFLITLAISAGGSALFQLANGVINHGPSPTILVAAVTQFTIGILIGGVIIVLRRVG